MPLKIFYSLSEVIKLVSERIKKAPRLVGALGVFMKKFIFWNRFIIELIS